MSTPSVSPTVIPDRLYFRIGDVAEIAGVKPYVLRYWETEFPMIAPEKSPTGQRVYRRTDVETVLMIKRLLYQERYSIEGARRKVKELRKEGELKNFKSESAQANLLDSSAATEQVRVGLKTRISELRELVETPATEFFKY